MYKWVPVLFLMSSCIMGNPQSRSSSDPQDLEAQKVELPQGRIQAALQKKELEAFQASQNKEVWALFSYSGWLDRGQILVFKDDRDQLELAYYPPGKKEQLFRKSLDAETFAKLKQVIISSSELKDFASNSFDGVEYEYLHLRKNDGGSQVLQKIYMKNPDLGPQGKNHQKLVDAFHALPKTP